MSNELILSVWEQLSSVNVIYSFFQLNGRFNSLFMEFTDLYKQLDLRFYPLSASRFFCRQVPSTNEWCLDLTSLKLGNCYRSWQFGFVVDHFAKQDKSCANTSKDVFRVLTTYSKHIPPTASSISFIRGLSNGIHQWTLSRCIIVCSRGWINNASIHPECGSESNSSFSSVFWLFWTNLWTYPRSCLGSKSFARSVED